jgi:molybdopterin/thiamine biosynthesis adenylyltransferase/rhodanese-related sulfurtransferase
MQRYHRQSILPEIGNKGQDKILASKVLIVGAGGLGHPAAQYLAGMGVGQIEIVDGDDVHITNLHRQILFTETDLGKNKAEVLSKRLAMINGNLKVSFIPKFLNRSLALDLFDKFDVILDCTDNFESKFLINDVCALYDKPLVYGAISQFEGQVGVFWKSKGPCYRCLYSEIPKSKIQNCAEAGVVGPVVGVIGALQAMEALKIIVGQAESGSARLNPLIGKINFYDFCDHSFRSLSVSKRSDCRCHSSGFNKNDIIDFQREECVLSSSALLVDVRETDEWNEFHIKGSLNLPLSALEAGELPGIDKNKEMTLICKAGSRAKRAEEILKKLNYTKIRCSDRGVYEYQTR